MDLQSCEAIQCAAECHFIAACANKAPNCVSWGQNGFIAVGSGDSVAICGCRRAKSGCNIAVKTLNAHKGRVNCVEWVRGARKRSATSYLLSGSTDKSIVVWKCELSCATDEYASNFLVVNTLKGHDDIVTCVDGMFFDNNNFCDGQDSYIFASAAVDSVVKIWGNFASSDPKDAFLLQSIDVKPGLALTMSLCLLKGSIPLLACGLDNCKVRLYAMADRLNVKDQKEFTFALILPGHEDWVRGTDFVSLQNGHCLLATCSQDAFIRLWRISPQIEYLESEKEDILKMKEAMFTTYHNEEAVTFVVTLEAVLSGHEGWIYSVDWSTSSEGDRGLRLLSASMDKSVIIWKIDEGSGIWVEAARFGEVGGNTLGFYGARFNLGGTAVIAHSYNGALHCWERAGGKDKEEWKTGVIASGHFGSVLDLSWEPVYGRYFVTTSADQTTRLFGTWKVGDLESWHEIARPQIHGYDMQCVSMIDSFRFISGADEKVLRVFEAPENFVKNFESLSNCKMSRTSAAPEGATVPALGLSNKAVFSSYTDSEKETPTSRGEQYIENQFKGLSLDQPPSEEHLLQNSLWPETHKLYSHVFEIFCVAASSSGALVASAAKSATPQHSTIVLWDTKMWKEVAELHGHTLTVTQMEFSHNDTFLLSVSRDRTWILHRIVSDSDSNFSVATFAKSDKKTCHARIIWSASWTHDDLYFCTASRDKKVMFWKIDNESSTTINEVNTVSRSLVAGFSEPITAVSFANRLVASRSYLLCVGKDSGLLELHVFIPMSKIQCNLLHRFDVHESHASAVKRIKWRPRKEKTDNKHWFASCGADNMVRLICSEIS